MLPVEEQYCLAQRPSGSLYCEICAFQFTGRSYKGPKNLFKVFEFANVSQILVCDHIDRFIFCLLKSKAAKTSMHFKRSGSIMETFSRDIDAVVGCCCEKMQQFQAEMHF